MKFSIRNRCWNSTIRRIAIAALLFVCFQAVGSIFIGKHDVTGGSVGGRKLLSTVPWETCDFEMAHARFAFIVPYIFVIFLCFIGLALICDDFFVPSLEAISEKLDLSEDVAGATFMAAGSSAPELFTSLAAVSVESDVGIGTIVGSAMFNILIIIALSAVLAGKTLNLDWRPLFRDAAVYGLSICIFIGFAWNGQIEWYEALIMFLLYIAYIALMKFNPLLMRLLLKIECAFCRNTRVQPDDFSSSSGSVRSQSQSDVNEGSTTNSQSNFQGEHEEGHSQSHHHHEHGHHHHEHGHHHHHEYGHHHHPDHPRHFVHSHRGQLAGSINNRRRSLVAELHHTSSNESNRSSQVNANINKVAEVSNTQNEVAHDTDQPKDESESKTTQESCSRTSSQSQGSWESVEEPVPSITLLPCLPPIRGVPPDLEEAKEGGVLGWIKFVFKLLLFMVSFPFMVLFTWTIPNCSINSKWYVVTASFLMSIFWIAVFSFVMVTVVAKLGCILEIGSFTMGLVVVAIGTSVPDAISSILVARDGFGDMAVSNAIGSNVFDINLGLGLPFLIRIAIDKGRAFSLLTQEQLASLSEYPILPHPKFGFVLLLILLLVLVTFFAFRFRLNTFTGLTFVVLYMLFLAYAFIQEMVCDTGKHC